MPKGVSEGEQFENQSQLFRKSIVIKSFSESENLSKSQQGGIQPNCHERACRLCQSDFQMEAKGAGLGKTMPPRTLPISRTTNVTEIWEEAERRPGASRANFSLVRSGSHYLPPGGFLDNPEQLFEIRWQGRGGVPGRPVEVTWGDRIWLEPCDTETSLQKFLVQIRVPEREDRLVFIRHFLHEGRLKGLDATDEVLSYFPKEEKPAIKIGLWWDGYVDPPYWWKEEETQPTSGTGMPKEANSEPDPTIPVSGPEEYMKHEEEEQSAWIDEEDERLPVWVNFNGDGFWDGCEDDDLLIVWVEGVSRMARKSWVVGGWKKGYGVWRCGEFLDQKDPDSLKVWTCKTQEEFDSLKDEIISEYSKEEGETETGVQTVTDPLIKIGTQIRTEPLAEIELQPAAVPLTEIEIQTLTNPLAEIETQIPIDPLTGIEAQTPTGPLTEIGTQTTGSITQDRGYLTWMSAVQKLPISITVGLDNGQETRWIQVGLADAVNQIFEYFRDTAREKVRLKVRGIDLEKANLQDRAIIQVLGKGLGGGLDEPMVTIQVQLHDRKPVPAIIPMTWGPIAIKSFIEHCFHEVVEDSDIPINQPRTFTQGELFKIGGQDEWSVPSGDHIFTVKAAGSNKKDRVWEQIASIWVVEGMKVEEVKEAVNRDWKQPRIVLPMLEMRWRSWTKEILSWGHYGVIEWLDEVPGTAKINDELLAGLWSIPIEEAQLRIQAEWWTPAEVDGSMVRYHPTLRKGLTVYDWTQIQAQMAQGMMLPILIWNGKMHRPYITTGKPIDYTARELSNQLWCTIEANQIFTQHGTLWDGRWEFNLSLRLAKPWMWVIDHLAEKVEINPRFRQQDFREQLLRRGLNPDQFEFPKGKGHNQVIKYIEPGEASRAGSLRGGVGSGPTDTCVAQGNPSKT
jgi:hypothetical protein